MNGPMGRGASAPSQRANEPDASGARRQRGGESERGDRGARPYQRHASPSRDAERGAMAGAAGERGQRLTADENQGLERRARRCMRRARATEEGPGRRGRRGRWSEAGEGKVTAGRVSELDARWTPGDAFSREPARQTQADLHSVDGRKTGRGEAGERGGWRASGGGVGRWLGGSVSSRRKRPPSRLSCRAWPNEEGPRRALLHRGPHVRSGATGTASGAECVFRGHRLVGGSIVCMLLARPN